MTAVADLGHEAKRGPRRMLRALIRFIVAWRRHQRDRRLLASLSERELRDIGIDRGMVSREDDPVFSRWR